MNAYPHVRLPSTGPVFLAHCRCGAGLCMPQMSEHPPYTPAPESWGSDCSSAMRERIGELEAERDAAHAAGRLAERADVVASLRESLDFAKRGGDSTVSRWIGSEMVNFEAGEHVGTAVKP